MGAGPDDHQTEIEHLKTLLDLAKVRHSPPRCLSCGEASVTFLEFDDAGTSSNFIHNCGRRLYQVPSDRDAPRVAYPPETVVLDSEGHRIFDR